MNPTQTIYLGRDHETIARAAKLTGVSLSAYVRGAALARAQSDLARASEKPVKRKTK